MTYETRSETRIHRVSYCHFPFKKTGTFFQVVSPPPPQLLWGIASKGLAPLEMITFTCICLMKYNIDQKCLFNYYDGPNSISPFLFELSSYYCHGPQKKEKKILFFSCMPFSQVRVKFDSQNTLQQ